MVNQSALLAAGGVIPLMEENRLSAQIGGTVRDPLGLKGACFAWQSRRGCWRFDGRLFFIARACEGSSSRQLWGVCGEQDSEKKKQGERAMATTSPAGVTTENSTFTTIISVVALIAIVALIYFIARGRATSQSSVEKAAPPVQQESQPAAPK